MLCRNRKAASIPREELICGFSVADEHEVEVGVDEERQEQGVELRSMDVKRLRNRYHHQLPNLTISLLPRKPNASTNSRSRRKSSIPHSPSPSSADPLTSAHRPQLDQVSSSGPAVAAVQAAVLVPAPEGEEHSARFGRQSHRDQPLCLLQRRRKGSLLDSRRRTRGRR
jgi:hypothetical protein